MSPASIKKEATVLAEVLLRSELCDEAKDFTWLH